ncbi:MAG: MFS transporter [Alphaproteobacteria bacterium]
MAPRDATPVPWRVQAAVYGAGLFSNSSLQLYNVIVPLWVLVLAPSPFVVGIVLASRQFLPMLLSIHGGALMDRFGVRRVMLGFAAMAMVIPLFYPMLPFIPAVVVLQMLSGLAVMLCWVGVQSMIGHIMQGHPVYTGRLTLSTRIGVFAGPPLAGAMWDLGGPWAAFGFLTLWATGAFVCTLAVPTPPPEADRVATEGGRAPTTSKIGPRDLLPNPRDYIAAFSLLGIPAIAMVISATMLRHSSVGMQSSFYIVYLGQLGISGTAIGTLISVTGIFGALGSLFVGRLARLVAPRLLLLTGVAIGTTMIMITPLLGAYVLLLIAQSLRGLCSGIASSMEISLMARSAGVTAQGKGAALRLTMGRTVAVVVPVVMGGVVELAGLENSFYVVGGTILALLVWVGLRGEKAS